MSAPLRAFVGYLAIGGLYEIHIFSVKFARRYHRGKIQYCKVIESPVRVVRPGFLSTNKWCGVKGMAMLKILLGGVCAAVIEALLGVAPAAAQCTVTYTFTNGTTADANQVNTNFGNLTSCAAPLANPNFTGNPNAPNWYVDGSTTISAGTVGFSNVNGPAVQFFGTSAGGAPGALRFLTAGAESARFGSNGSFLVGTTTNGGWTGNATAEFVSAGAQALSAYSVAGNALVLRVDNTTNDLAWLIYNGTPVGSITTNGTSVSYNTTSDERLKSILPYQKDYRSIITRLWVGDFQWKKNGNADFGIIAQQTYPLFPEAITKPSDASKLWEADYGKLAPLALWGVKDLYKTIGYQSARIKELKQDLSSLQHVSDNEAAEIQALKNQMADIEHKLQVQTAQR